jgi:repressor LexA
MVLLELTDRQKEVYDFVRECILRNGAPPTLREIGEQFGMSSTNAVRDVLAALERKGYINRSEYKSRGIELADEVRAGARAAVVGRGGRFSLLAVQTSANIAVDARWCLGPSSARSRRQHVQGIHDGDYVFVKSENLWPATWSWRHRRQATVVVPPARAKSASTRNPSYEPIVVSRQAELAGKVIGMMRRFR